MVAIPHEILEEAENHYVDNQECPGHAYNQLVRKSWREAGKKAFSNSTLGSNR